MKATNNYEIAKNKKGEIWNNFKGNWSMPIGPNELILANKILKECRKKNKNEQEIERLINEYLNCSTTPIQPQEQKEHRSYSELELVMQSIINFFSEFDFEPNFRFINTFANICNRNMTEAKQYVANYFKLTDNIFKDAIIDKLESSEFTQIVTFLHNTQVTKNINSRLEIYYGSQGTGKTTDTIKKSSQIMVCHSGMLPSDLMEDFKFENGQPTFRPSALQLAMTEGNGSTITLDEFNLLPFESLRFIQSITDGKQQFEYKGKTIQIKPGFKIIGTMNLTVNGSVFSLPEPLVDRAMVLREYKLTAQHLVNAI